MEDMLNENIVILMEEVKKNTVMECARKYGFNLEEALSGIGVVNIEKKSKENKRVEKVEKAVIPLPFIGIVMEGKCHGLKQNHGLITQCRNESKEEYCKGCKKQCEKNESGKPDSGCIEDRMAALKSGIEYRDPKGRRPMAYAKIMQKLKLTREMVEAEAAKENVILSESVFVMPESKRGRPKKANDTGSETCSEPKKRGRPKKIEKPVEVSSTEDLFASLISEMKTTPKTEEKPKSTKEGEKQAAKAKKEEEKQAAKAKKEEEKQAAKLAKEGEKKASKAKKESEKKVPKNKKDDDAGEKVEEEKEEEVVVTVKKFEFNGKMYLRTADNVLYDPDTQDEVGVFNEALQKIDECELESESEEEDDE
jgi:chemotaxis protein histidine kinase CheA